MKRRTCAVITLLAALGTSLALPAAAADTPQANEQPQVTEQIAWDQAAVTALARELSEAISVLRTSIQREPTLGGVPRNTARILDDLRVAQSSARWLASSLGNGEGPVDTYPIYQRIQRLSGDIGRGTRRSAFTTPTTSQLEATGALLDRLSAYYAAEAAAYEAEGIE